MDEIALTEPPGSRPPIPAVDPPASAVGDPPQLLDVDVDELARSLPLVADDHPGGPVEVS
jgi:hypothetical protein